MKATYTKFFETEKAALARCSMKNRVCRRAGNFKDIYAVIDGPEDNYAVVDLGTAIDFNSGYQIAD